MSSPYRAHAFTLCFCVLTVSASFQAYSARPCPQPDAYGVERARIRLRDLAKKLPPDVAVAYVSDLPTEQHVGGMALHAVQYALAPRLVIDIRYHPSAEWVIGDFSRPVDSQKLGQERGLQMFHDFGNGIVLYRRDRS